LEKLNTRRKVAPNDIPYVNLATLAVPAWSIKSKRMRELDDEEEIERLNLPPAARAAAEAAKALADREKTKQAARDMSQLQWHQNMMTYVMATAITGGRLSPGILLTHMATMGAVLEALVARKDVMYKNAFLDYDELTREHWRRSANLDLQEFSLSKSVAAICEQRLALVIRENPKTGGGATDSHVDVTKRPSTVKPHKPQPIRPQANNRNCFICGGFGHLQHQCPNAQKQHLTTNQHGGGVQWRPQHANTQAAAWSEPPPMVPLNDKGAKGGFVPQGKGGKSNQGKGKRY
jgi:hypothetical protein